METDDWNGKTCRNRRTYGERTKGQDQKQARESRSHKEPDLIEGHASFDTVGRSYVPGNRTAYASFFTIARINIPSRASTNAPQKAGTRPLT